MRSQVVNTCDVRERMRSQVVNARSFLQGDLGDPGDPGDPAVRVLHMPI